MKTDHNKTLTTIQESKPLLLNLIENRSKMEAVRYIQKLTGLKKTQSLKYINDLIANNIPEPVSGQNQTVIKVKDVTTLEQLVEVSQIDTKKWNIDRFNVRKDSIVVKGEDGQKIEPRYEVEAFLSNKMGDLNLEELLKDFENRASKNSPKKFNLAPKVANADCLYILNIQDLHLSKLCWGKETGGADYDIEIAKKVYRDAVLDLLGKVDKKRISEVLLVVGSDFFHVDNNKSTTTKGTYVDSDTRWYKAFTEGCELIAEVTEKIAALFKVKVVVVSGNHGEISEQAMGSYLKAWFRNHKNVEIDNNPQKRKYYSYGKNLLGFVHGNKEKTTELPLIMVRENQGEVSNYKWFYWLTGHLHHTVVKDFKGFQIRTCNALCPPDSYHADHGYIGNTRNSEGLLFNKENGLEAVYYSQPLD